MRIDDRLARFRDGTEPLIVWGTGQLTMKLLAETTLAQARIVSLVDGNPINQGKELRGIPIIAPEQVTDQRPAILIATLLHSKQIAATIKDTLKLRNSLITLD